ncbi:MAG: sulfatase [Acidobacteriota bacterium]
MASPPRNVVLIVVDTLRADHLGAYGYARPTSPNLDRFMAESVTFDSARSQAACTFPSVNSLLTSRAAVRFLDQPAQDFGIPSSMVSLPEVLSRQGYDTAAISASAIVRATPSRFNPHGGFGRGFASFDEDCAWKSADCVNAKAFTFLGSSRAARPFFLYLHYIDPHGPYRAPPTQSRLFAGSAPAAWPAWVAGGDPNPLAAMLYAPGGKAAAVDRAQLAHLVDLYDDEIHYFDGQFAALLAELSGRGLDRSTIVIFAADHGEHFLEHGELKHCRSVFDVEVRTPLAMRIPDQSPRRVKRAVENLDIGPTVTALLGIDAAPLAFEGTSLLAPDAEAERGAFSAQGTQRSVVRGRLKLIHDLDTGHSMLFDLASDPGEMHDVARQRPEDFRALRQLLIGWVARVEGGGARKSVDAAKAAEQQLKSLGYLE